MIILHYTNYLNKKNHKDYLNLKNRLEAFEKDISNREKEEVSALLKDRKISTYKRIKRIADYRLGVFLYEDYVLFVDILPRNELPNSYDEIIFDKADEVYIDFIEKNKPKIEEEIIDLNDYNELLNIKHEDEYEICYESFEFVRNLKKYTRKEFDKIFRLIKSVVNEDEGGVFKNYKTIFYHTDGEFNLYYKRLRDNEVEILLLIDVSKDGEISDEYLNKLDEIVYKDELTKRASKSYPLSIFLEDEANDWIEYIIKNSDGNIALSPEEESILISLKSYQNDKKYPFFINGRAGSGKSTILQYLFGDYIIKFLELKQTKDLKYQPLYLTYNDRLKEKAIEKVVSIILAKTDSALKEKLNLKTKDVVYRKIEDFFKSFDTKEGENFLEELLSSNKKPNSLKDKTKVSFGEIKEHFKKQIKTKGKRYQRDFTPELVWYVIRSLIKGMGIDTLEKYQNLSRDLRIIRDETFNIVLNEFYKTYQNNYLKQNNYYDDLDLVLEVFKQNAFDKKYSVIFCDEAQDFTKIEFDMILNLNIFLEKNIKIDNFDYKNIPIVFAGDPFQTINPTGFSFKYLEANVYQSYLEKNITKEKIVFNPKELEFNYRSNEEIVKFSNLIQVLRGILFRDKDISLQTKWLDDYKEGKSLLFYLDNNKEIKKFLKEKDFLHFIFPIDQRQDKSYDGVLKQDEFITKFFEKKEYDTPLKVKGLEFPWVVLYKFGDFYLENYDEIEKFLENGFKDKESSLPYEYFFNNFYVAVTRPKEKLLIIDSEEGYNKFWANVDLHKLLKLYQKISDKITTDQDLATFIKGDMTDLEYEEIQEVEWLISKIKILIFERYEDEVNKSSILYDIEDILKRNKLNKVYSLILDGYKAELEDKYIKSVKRLMKASKMAKENDELANNEIHRLIQKAFNNLYKSVEFENEEIVEILEKHKDKFKKLGLKQERKVNVLERFLNKRYLETLDYIKSENLPKDKVLNFIIDNALKNIELFEAVDYMVDLFREKYITKNYIIEFIKTKSKEPNFDDYKTLLKLFDIDDIKKENKNIFCELNLKVNPDDIDCLMFSSDYEKVISLVKSKNVDVSDYYKQLLFYIDKHSKEYNLIDLDNLIKLYKENYKDLSKDVWNYILQEVFKKDNVLMDKIPDVMKSFDEFNRKELQEHLIILIAVLKELPKIVDNFLFNTLITLFSKDVNYKLCDGVVLLEKTMSFFEPKNIEKIKGFYKYYLKEKNNYKAFIGSRYLKVVYDEKYEKIKKLPYKERMEELNATIKYEINRLYLKKMFSNLDIDDLVKNVLHKIKSRMDDELCSKLYKEKYIDDVYKKIMESYVKSENPTPKPEPIQEVSVSVPEKEQTQIPTPPTSTPQQNVEVIEDKFVIKRDNIVEILEEIQDFLDEQGQELDRKLIRKINNTLTGMLEDIKDLKSQ